MKEDYKVSDYEVFNDAIKATQTLEKCLKEAQTELKSNKDKLNEDTFKGTIRDYCVEKLGKSSNNIQAVAGNFSSYSTLFSETVNSYKKGDKEAFEKIISSDKFTTIAGTVGVALAALTTAQKQQMLQVAKAEIGKPWKSLAVGASWGCAQYVSKIYNDGVFNGKNIFNGSTTSFWGNVAPGESRINEGFELVSEEEAQEGDVACFIFANHVQDPFSSAGNCEHVAYYLGDGKMIDSEPNGGVKIRNVSDYGQKPYYLHYTGETK